MKKLDQWFMSWLPSDGYKSPEQRQKIVCGLVNGRETYIAVAPEAIKGRIITLTNGDQYELGDREPGYVAYCEKYKIPYDEANPIKIVTELSPIPDEPRTKITNTVSVSGDFVACPFCDGKISATMKDVPNVAHSQPPCKKFIETEDALEFLTAANEAKRQQNG